MSWSIAILAVVTLERLGELVLASANTRRLRAAGGREYGRGHYPWIVAAHAAWLVALWWLAPGRPIEGVWLAVFAVLLIARLWVIATLGRRWTTRIIAVPGETLVRRGPYRFVDHPNYVVVVGEIAVLPLVFGLWPVALVFSLLNAAVLWVRIRAENGALGRVAPPAA